MGARSLAHWQAEARHGHFLASLINDLNQWLTLLPSLGRYDSDYSEIRELAHHLLARLCIAGSSDVVSTTGRVASVSDACHWVEGRRGRHKVLGPEPDVTRI